jgi:hypothetical protein
MLKLMFVGSIALATFSACEASAQGICPLNGTPSHNLVCVLPQLYGPSGLGSGPNAPLLANSHQAHFEGDFLSSFGPINEAVSIQVPQLFSSPYTDLGKCGDASCTDLTPGTMHPDLGVRTTDYNIFSGSLGIKYRPFGNLVLTGNVLLKMNNSGLRSTAIPLVGLSYSF